MNKTNVLTMLGVCSAGLMAMSKKSFKKAIGGLYKERLIAMTPEGIVLRATVPPQ